MTERRGEIDPKTGRQAVYDDEKIVHCLRPATTSTSPGCEISGRCTCNCADCNGRTWRDAEEPQPYGRYKPIECIACGAGSTLSPVPGYRGRCTRCGLVQSVATTDEERAFQAGEITSAELRFRGKVPPKGEATLVMQPEWAFRGQSLGHSKSDLNLQRAMNTMRLLVTSIRCGHVELLIGISEISMTALLGNALDFPTIASAERITVRCRNPHDRELEADFVVSGMRVKPVPGATFATVAVCLVLQ